MLPRQKNQLTISILSRLRQGGAPEGQNPNFDMDKAGFEPSGDEDQMNENEVMLGDADIDSAEADQLVGKKKTRKYRGK